LLAYPDNAQLLYGRGIARQRLGQRKDGQADMDAALRLTPRMGGIYAQFGIKP
jgi:lipoprotein NlpI